MYRTSSILHYGWHRLLHGGEYFSWMHTTRFYSDLVSFVFFLHNMYRIILRRRSSVNWWKLLRRRSLLDGTIPFFTQPFLFPSQWHVGNNHQWSRHWFLVQSNLLSTVFQCLSTVALHVFNQVTLGSWFRSNNISRCVRRTFHVRPVHHSLFDPYSRDSSQPLSSRTVASSVVIDRTSLIELPLTVELKIYSDICCSLL